MHPRQDEDRRLLEHVAAAQRGDQAALEHVVGAVQDRVHHLAMRILVDREDARDATQEILIRVVTKLSTFRGESGFQTWVYRVAVNYLLTAKKVRSRDPALAFEAFEADLADGLPADPAPPAEDTVLLNELRIACTMAMLLCLDLRHRIAYVLGDVLELDHTAAAEALGITKANYRKRLSRARARVVAFTARACGLANENAQCNCPRRLPVAMARGCVSPQRIDFAVSGAPDYDAVRRKADTLQGELIVLCLQQATPRFSSPEDFGAHVARLVSGHY